jgi:DnaB-helicase binding domain of primase
VASVLERADLSAPLGRDRALAELGPVFAEAPPSIERDELVSHVASRLRLPVELEQRLRRTSRRGGSRRGAGATATRARVDPDERDERLLLAFCLASGERGAEVLEHLGADAFVGEGHAKARRFVLRRLRGLPPAEGDAALAAELEPELIALAAREGGESALDEKAAYVELRAVERRIEPLKVKLAGDDITREEARELATLQSEAQRLHEQATRPH